MPSLATAVNIARLYDELRDSVRANDQEGVKRVFNELVLARRPVAEILAEVRSISKERERSEPAGDAAAIREWPPRDTPAEAAARTSGSTVRNFGRSIGPQAVPKPSDIPHEENRSLLDEWPRSRAPAMPPRPEPHSQDRTFDPSSIPQHPDSTRPEPGVAKPLSLDDGEPQHPVRFAIQPSAADPTDRIRQGRQNIEPREDPPTSAGFEEAPPDPSCQSVDGTVSRDPAIVGEPGQERVLDPALDEARRGSTSSALAQSAADAAPQVSSRAVSLGVELDPSPDAIGTARPKRRAPWALVVVIAIIASAGGGWFVLMRPPGEQTAVKAAPSSQSVATAGGERPPMEAAPTGQLAVATATNPAAGEHAAETVPAPATPAPAAPPPVAAAAAPADRSAPKPDGPPAVAKLEMPTSAAATPDAQPPATAPAATASPAVSPQPQPRASAAETAPLLARGDSLFGVGDVSSARLFYERAADAGDGQAALRLGETYDPTFLERAQLRAVRGDAAAAVFWYRRARELGVAEAEILLKGIQTK